MVIDNHIVQFHGSDERALTRNVHPFVDRVFAAHSHMMPYGADLARAIDRAAANTYPTMPSRSWSAREVTTG